MEYVINNDILESVIPKAGDTEIIIPDGVKGLGKSLWNSIKYGNRDDYKNISRIFIPASFVDFAEEKLFRYDAWNSVLVNLREFVVDSHNPIYESIDGVLFKKDNGEITLLFYPRGRICEEYAIPDGVTHIRKNAFASTFNGPHSLVFPKSIKSVDKKIGGTSHSINRITIYENLSCDFSIDTGTTENWVTWVWNWNGKNNLLVTVLSLDENVKYKIPIFLKHAVYRAGAICMACNPINNAKLGIIDFLFEELKNKDEKLLTATVRIGWPHTLTQIEKKKYEQYVSRYIIDAVNATIKLGYPDLIEVFIQNKLIKKTAFPAILSAVEAGQYAKQKAMLLDYYNGL